jgi:hypothetical protein
VPPHKQDITPPIAPPIGRRHLHISTDKSRSFRVGGTGTSTTKTMMATGGSEMCHYPPLTVVGLGGLAAALSPCHRLRRRRTVVLVPRHLHRAAGVPPHIRHGACTTTGSCQLPPPPPPPPSLPTYNVAQLQAGEAVGPEGVDANNFDFLAKGGIPCNFFFSSFLGEIESTTTRGTTASRGADEKTTTGDGAMLSSSSSSFTREARR